MKKLILILVSILAYQSTIAQDVIQQNDGKRLKVKITELADGYVKFYHFEDPDKVEIKMNRSLIKEIKFEYGRKEQTIEPGLNEAYFVNDKRNNIKLNFLGIAGGSTILSYERGLNPFSSVEGSVKLHGVGVGDEAKNKSGFGIEGAYKMKFGKLFGKGDYRPKHLLNGFYLKPGLGFSAAKTKVWVGSSYNTVTNTTTNIYSDKEYNYFHGGLDIGKQWILNNKLSLEPYAGLHYYGGKNEEKDSPCQSCAEQFSISDGNMSGSRNSAGRFGINIGYLFK